VLNRQSLGKYKIIKRIGSGGFGSVYLAVDTWIKRKVAIKVPHNQSEEIEKLLHEPRIQASLPHPNIVQIYSVEKKEGIFFIVSEFMPGSSLDKYLKSKGKLDWQKAVSMIYQICDAVQFAHDNKIIHRDIRPANILLSNNEKIKMTDFGTSRFLNPDSVAITRIGCPPYMAPEHFNGKTTYQSDVYAIGMMLYELLVGKLPFSSFNPLKIEEEVKNKLLTSINNKTDFLTENQSAIIMKALEKSLSNRFKTANEFKQALISLEEHTDSLENKENQIYIPSSPVKHPAKDTPKKNRKKICLSCGKLLSPRAKVCPYCYEEQ